MLYWGKFPWLFPSDDFHLLGEHSVVATHYTTGGVTRQFRKVVITLLCVSAFG